MSDPNVFRSTTGTLDNAPLVLIIAMSMQIAKIVFKIDNVVLQD